MTDQPKDIRLATRKDVEPLLEILTEAHRDVALAPMNRLKVCKAIIRAVERDLAIAGIIEGAGGRIEATIGMLASQWWYTDEYHIEDVWNFVHPDFRKSTHAKHLLYFSKWFAESMKMPVLMGVLTTKRTEEKVKLFQRQLPMVGALFLYPPRDLETDVVAGVEANV